MYYRTLAITVVALLLAGCSALSPVPTEATTTYIINTLPTTLQQKRTSLTLLVTPPQTSALYNTQRMVYMAQPYQLAYFAKSRWADTPANMLHTLLLQTLQNTQAFHAVISSPVMGHYDQILNTELIKLQQNFLSQRSTIELVLNIQVVDPTTNKIIIARRISIIETASENTPQGGAVAANQATAKALQQIVKVLLQTNKN